VKKVALVTGLDAVLSSPSLRDLSGFEEEMRRIKCLKEMKQTLDRHFLIEAIGSLGMKGKKMTAKRVKKVCKKSLAMMIEETRT